jgi:SAM-dependent methyltransferase
MIPEGLMDNYTTDKLVDVDPDEFHQQILRFRDLDDWKMEKYISPKGQRNLSVKFHWGHDHDFGKFKISGRMGNRHYKLPQIYDRLAPIHLICENANVLDIGCWTGGASLFYAAMKNVRKVIAIDEVQKYTDAVKYLKKSFNIGKLEVYCTSLFDFEGYEDYFDVINFSGVLYHLSDMITGLFRIHRMMSEGGCLLLESEVHKGEEMVAEYRGPTFKGWNWWFPTVNAIKQMLRDVGFENIKYRKRNSRVVLVAFKKQGEETYLMECGRPV